MRRALRSILPVTLLLTLSQPLLAADAPPTDPEKLFKEGRELLEKGELKEACERFAKSDEIDPAVGTKLNLGDCYERLGKVASAWEAYRSAAKLGRQKADERRATRADQAAARLEPRLARLTITATPDNPPGLAVTRNGTKVEDAALNTPVAIDPGSYTVEASAPGRKPWKTTGELAEGATINVPVPYLEDEQAARPVRPVQESNVQKTVGIGLEIGGGVVLATGLVFGGLALSRWNTVSAVCPDGKCATEEARAAQTADADSAKSLSTISTVGTIAGVALLAGGLALHLTAPKQRVAIRPMLGQTSFGAMFTLFR